MSRQLTAQEEKTALALQFAKATRRRLSEGVMESEPTQRSVAMDDEDEPTHVLTGDELSFAHKSLTMPASVAGTSGDTWAHAWMTGTVPGTVPSKTLNMHVAPVPTRQHAADPRQAPLAPSVYLDSAYTFSTTLPPHAILRRCEVWLRSCSEIQFQVRGSKRQISGVVDQCVKFYINIFAQPAAGHTGTPQTYLVEVQPRTGDRVVFSRFFVRLERALQDIIVQPAPRTMGLCVGPYVGDAPPTRGRAAQPFAVSGRSQSVHQMRGVHSHSASAPASVGAVVRSASVSMEQRRTDNHDSAAVDADGFKRPAPVIRQRQTQPPNTAMDTDSSATPSGAGSDGLQVGPNLQLAFP